MQDKGIKYSVLFIALVLGAHVPDAGAGAPASGHRLASAVRIHAAGELLEGEGHPGMAHVLGCARGGGPAPELRRFLPPRRRYPGCGYFEEIPP